MSGCDAAVTMLGGVTDGKRVDYDGNRNVVEAAGILGVTRWRDALREGRGSDLLRRLTSRVGACSAVTIVVCRQRLWQSAAALSSRGFVGATNAAVVVAPAVVPVPQSYFFFP